MYFAVSCSGTPNRRHKLHCVLYNSRYFYFSRDNNFEVFVGA